MISAEQIRAARAMLRWDQTKLAEAAGISVETIKRLEARTGILRTGRIATLEAIETAFAKAGIEFITGDAPGVRLHRKE